MNIAAPLKNEKGFMIPLAVVLSLVTAYIFAYILPQLHIGQQVAAITNLNEHRAYYAAKKGIDVTKLGVKYTVPGDFQDLIDDDADPNPDGIAQAINEILGTSASPKHAEYTYWDEDLSDKVTQFVSSCLNIDESEAGLLHEKGNLDIAIIVLRGSRLSTSKITSTNVMGAQSGVPDDEKDDQLYYWNGADWSSYDTLSSSEWDKFAYYDNLNEIWYCDFDLELSPGGGNAEEEADFIFKYNDTNDENWYVSIGNNGSFRDKDGANQLWDFVIELLDGNEPYIDGDNDGFDLIGCSAEDKDCIEVFIIVRSTGITVAPGPTYDNGPDPTDLKLVNSDSSHLPNPMRQVIEAGFYLYEDSSLKSKQFYFGKAHNLKEGDEP